jgi:tetratricopeptide (TPR) repeat protein
MLGGFSAYDHVRPRLRRSAGVRDLLAGLQYAEFYSPRAAVAGLRDYLLDFTGRGGSRVRLELAQALARERDPDFTRVADEIERAAARLLRRVGRERPPTRHDFEHEGFRLGWNYPDWPAPFLTTDVDGDGREDLLFAVPGNAESSVCFLFRHTRQGWVSHRLGLGVRVMGLWAFDLSRRGPRIIALASLTGSEYEPTLLLDLFTWQRGRMASVLSVSIGNGWQWEHRHRDSRGLAEIRVYSREIRPSWRHPAAQVVTRYRWSGSRFVLDRTTRLAVPSSLDDWLDMGRQRFAEGRYREAARALELATHCKPRGPQDASGADYDTRELQQGWYLLGLCRGLLGEFTASREAIQAAVLFDSQFQEVVTRRAEQFLAAASRPRDLPVALAAAGQLFRSLEVAQSTLRPSAELDGLLAAARIRPDTVQNVDLTGDGKPERLARIHWTGGSAVVAWERPLPPHRGRLWLLAYALTQRPTGVHPLTWPEWFYLPQSVPLALNPVADEVSIARIERRGAALPRVVIRYRQGIGHGEQSVVWQGERFAATDLPTGGGEALTEQLDRIEALLFERRAYQQALAALRLFEGRVRQARLVAEDKSDLLLEVYYHQAICLRKLGDTRRAAVVLTALWRTQPRSAWGQLAHRWLRFPIPAMATP